MKGGDGKVGGDGRNNQDRNGAFAKFGPQAHEYGIQGKEEACMAMVTAQVLGVLGGGSREGGWATTKGQWESIAGGCQQAGSHEH
jgi:hypothetical protein